MYLIVACITKKVASQIVNRLILFVLHIQVLSTSHETGFVLNTLCILAKCSTIGLKGHSPAPPQLTNKVNNFG